MSKVKFDCPHCSYSKELWKNEIPSKAQHCKCPRCKTQSSLTMSIKPVVHDGLLDAPQEELTVKQQAEKPSKDSEEEFRQLFADAMSAIEANNDIEALMLLEEAEKLSSTSILQTYLAYCRAKVNHEFADAIHACKQAIKKQPTVVDHYLNLGRIYMHINKRGPALNIFRKGMKLDNNAGLMKELRKFEKRKSPLIPSLSRDHMLNRHLGKVLTRLGIR